MISSSALIRLDDGTVEREISQVVKGDRIYNPLTGGSCEVSAVLHRKVSFQAEAAQGTSTLTPVRFDIGSIGGRNPKQAVWITQNAIVLHPEKPKSSSFTRITAAKALSLVGQPGITLDDQIYEINYTKIVLSEAGLLNVNGLILEAPALSILTSDHVRNGDASSGTSRLSRHVSRVH